jgi:ectoine hydroxylase-related dioxygenase (phytanoyl-CoA dioxygenase family)
MQDLQLPPITTDLDQARRDLDEYGLALLGHALNPDQLAAARARLIEQAQAEEEVGNAYRDGARDPRRPRAGPNQRVWNLINKGEIFREVAVAPRVLQLARHLLGNDILLSSMTANIANQGGARQAVHTDQDYIPLETPYPMVCDVAWMLVDFTEDNGATLVAPGSHRWRRIPTRGEVVPMVPATGPAGTALVFDGRLWHGTGENRTSQSRYAMFSYFCRSFVRQQENFALSLAPEAIAACSPDLLALLGFQVWHTLGMVEGTFHGTINSRPTRFSTECKPRDRV